MFSKLKEKLKESLSIFSKKAESEAEESNIKEITHQSTKEAEKQLKHTKKKEQKKETSEKVKKAEKEKGKKDTKITEKKEIVETILEESKSLQSIPIEKKESFFSRITKSWSRKEEATPEIEVKEEKKVELEKYIKEGGKKEIPIQEEETEKKGFFARVKETITTKTISEEKFQVLFWDLELVLLESNVSIEVIEKIKSDLKKELVDKPLPRDIPNIIKDTLKKTLAEILSFEQPNLINDIKQKKKKPFVIAFFGINGAGKTTSIAKLTHYFQKNKLSVVLAASDTFRAAAIQQLEEHAAVLKVKVIKHDYGADAAAVAFDTIKYAAKNNIDIVLIDTAGRLHSNTNLMAELEKIIRIAKPDLKIFVGESITGNDCIEQAQKFNNLVNVDGAILTKADIDEKGGAPLSIAYTIKKPIFFLGMGQKYEDLEVFEKDIILKRLGF